MKSKSSKTLKTVATKKAKTGRTKGAKSRTSSKRTISPMSFATTHISNLKGICVTATDESLSASYDLTPDLICEFYFREITRSAKEVSRHIRIGPKGLEYRGPSDGEFQTIGWATLEYWLDIENE